MQKEGARMGGVKGLFSFYSWRWEENVFQVIRQAHSWSVIILDAGLGQAALRRVEFWPLHSQLTEYTLDEQTVMVEQKVSLL